MAKEKKVKNSKEEPRVSKSGILKKAFADLNKKYGGNYAGFMQESNVLHRLPTGIFPVDVIAGGGIPIGLSTMIVGKEACAKTYTCLSIAKSAQNTCRFCFKSLHFCECGKSDPMFVLYIDAENKIVDIDWLHRIGVDTSEEKFGVVKPGFGVGHAANSALHAIETGVVDLVIIDSIAHLVPKDELEKDSEEDARVGLAAKKNNAFLRDFVCAGIRCYQQNGNLPTLVLVNQYRDNIGVMYGAKHVLPGGNGQKYVPSLVLEFKSAKYNQGEKERFAIADHGLFTVFVKKNNFGPPKGSTEFKLFFRDKPPFKKGMTDDVEWILFFCTKKLGLLEKEGNSYVLKIDKKMKFGTQKEFKEKLLSDDEFYRKVRAFVLRKAIETI